MQWFRWQEMKKGQHFLHVVIWLVFIWFAKKSSVDLFFCQKKKQHKARPFAINEGQPSWRETYTSNDNRPRLRNSSMGLVTCDFNCWPLRNDSKKKQRVSNYGHVYHIHFTNLRRKRKERDYKVRALEQPHTNRKSGSKRPSVNTIHKVFLLIMSTWHSFYPEVDNHFLFPSITLW